MIPRDNICWNYIGRAIKTENSLSLYSLEIVNINPWL